VHRSPARGGGGPRCGAGQPCVWGGWCMLWPWGAASGQRSRRPCTGAHAQRAAQHTRTQHTTHLLVRKDTSPSYSSSALLYSSIAASNCRALYSSLPRALCSNACGVRFDTRVCACVCTCVCVCVRVCVYVCVCVSFYRRRHQVHNSTASAHMQHVPLCCVPRAPH
jgi:hypothetical protein